MTEQDGDQDARREEPDAGARYPVWGQTDSGGLRKDLLREFKARPIGTHSGDLQRVLNMLRGGPLSGKFVLICLRPHREWVLARLPGCRGVPLEILEDKRFTSIAEAEQAVFELRWRALTGRPPG